MTGSGKERRTSRRLKSEAEAEFKVFNDSMDILQMGYKKARSKNVSMGGICLAVDSEVAAGNVVRVDIPIGGSGAKINTFCEVAWCRKDLEGYLAGFSFISLAEEETKLIDAYIKSYN